MKLSSLPDIYQKLAMKRIREVARNTVAGARIWEDLGLCFSWSNTPEGKAFWSKCHHAKSIKSLPSIPKSSLADIKFEHLYIKYPV